MSLWMLWTVVVAVVVAAGCVVLERALSTRGLPARWVWLSALPGIFGLSAWAALRTAPAATVLGMSPASTGAAPTPAAPEGRVVAWVRILEGAVRWTDTAAPWTWALATGVTLVVIGVGLVVLRRRAGRWAIAEVEGEPVALSEDFGPALVGVWRPTIVLPRWILGLRDRERRLALRHEVEHRDARDTLVLTLGTLAAALMPWNPAIWFVTRRLRQAVEVDCDRRVLASGADPVEYGSLLIELSAASPRYGLFVAALTQPASLLERRLTMMTKKTKRSSLFGAVGALSLSGLVLVAACDSPPPSMTGPEAEAAVESAVDAGNGALEHPILVGGGDEPRIYIDGVLIEPETVAATLSAIDPEDIERVEVMKGDAARALFGDEGSSGVVQIFLKSEPGAEPESLRFGAPVDAGGEPTGVRLREPGTEPSGELEFGTQARVRAPGGMAPSVGEMKLFVDGEAVSSLEDIRPQDVERMDVVGGEDGDEIHVTLKRSASSGGS